MIAGFGHYAVGKLVLSSQFSARGLGAAIIHATAIVARILAFVSCRVVDSVHRKSEASHLGVEGPSILPRIFDNET
jgi:hypothetical protein